MGRVGRKKKTKALRQALKDIRANKGTIYIVFDNVPRVDDSPMKNRETDFEFYNRSSRPSISRVRDFIEECISNYPKDEVEDLKSRLRSGDNVHFKSASFELFIHEALSRQGYKLTPHPKLPNGSPYKPDFLVKDKSGEMFYLEAVLATENNDIDKGGEARKGIVLDTLSSSPHHNFMIDINDDGSPKTPPSGKKLKAKIHQWLDTLDPDDIAEQVQHSGMDSITPLTWSHDGWGLQIRPIPLKADRRGKSKNLVGIGCNGGGWLDAWSPIRDAIKLKGGKYGELDAPLVVAVNLDSFHLERIDEMQALYGQEQYVFQSGSDAEPKMHRAPNGAWYGKKGPLYTRVSAAWIFNDLHATSLAGRRNTIYFNPWASVKAPESLKCFPYAQPDGSKMQWNDGLTFREVFKLPEGWPGNV